MLKLTQQIISKVRTQAANGLRLELVFPEHKTRQFIFRFPGDTDKETRNFTVLLRVLEIISANLAARKKSPLRDIYYLDVDLFRNSQSVVNSAVDRLCALLRTTREQLNIVASPSGLVSGNLSIALTNSQVTEISYLNGPSLIPVEEIMYVLASRPPQFALIIEKEAVFSTLCKHLPNAILITGRGFPCKATRRLVVALQTTYPDLPFFALVDSDPHGILILRTYTHLSDQPVHLNFLGVSLLDYKMGLVNTTPNDKRMAISTLKKDWINDPNFAKCKTELQRGLFMGKKAELNLLDKNHSQNLAEYVLDKVGVYTQTTQDENTQFSQRLVGLSQTLNESYDDLSTNRKRRRL